MTQYLQNRLTYVWLFLTVITIVSWWIGRNQGIEFQINSAVTISVLLMAAIKVHFVIHYFMEVRSCPAWLKRTVYGWNILVLALLVLFYRAAL